ncbi:YkvA family protein [Streptomyces sp. NPDC088354]|uniref:YkvA family protein n=1 Tax=unclassified Streptomyces TaxID=2593676 RepID=UPI0029A624C1|nr:YkvA family protein [Streptomyces sp. MI02-7b]MDX3078551.1 YkvA family protein [Streptomyces sp. MI02-7b]
MGDWSTTVLVIAGVAVAAMLAVAVVLVVKMARVRSLLRSADVPRSGKLAFWAAVVYLVCPVDLLPDPILIDDIGVLLLALRSLKTAADQQLPAHFGKPRKTLG